MSRIGKLPVALAKGVEAKIDGGNIVVRGPKGEMTSHILRHVAVEVKDGAVHVTQTDESREANMSAGTMRSLVNSMVKGVTQGFEVKLALVGVGYRAQAQGDTLNLQLGFSHPIAHKLPEGVTCKTPTPTEIILSSVDKQKVGQTAAVIRSYRPPEPYKGKGVRYADEHVVIKETKKK